MIQIQKNVSLLRYNSFKIDARARYFIELQNELEIEGMSKNEIIKNNKRYILGGGSNSLFTKDFDGVVIKNNIKGKEIVEEDENEVVIKVGAGENRDELIKWTVFDKGRHGGENLVLIPGDVGASPVQNIGAYGIEAKDLITKVEGYNTKTEQKEILSKKDCKFGYRNSIFKNEYKDIFIISYVYLKFKKNNYIPKITYGGIQKQLEINFPDQKNYSVKEVTETIIQIRESKLPNREEIGTAGSFFKNPIIPETQFLELQKIEPTLVGHSTKDKETKLSAGQLIDICVGKGFSLGNASTYKNHALVLINSGGATGQEIVNLANHIQTEVQKKFNIQLEPEVNYI